MAFACPACSAPVAGSLELPALRCGACGSRLRSRPLEGSADLRVYEVEAAGRPGTRTRVEVPWTPGDARRLRAWLVWSSAITLGLAGLLLAAALLLR